MLAKSVNVSLPVCLSVCPSDTDIAHARLKFAATGSFTIVAGIRSVLVCVRVCSNKWKKTKRKKNVNEYPER